MIWYFVIALIIIGIDQASKYWIVHNMELYQSIPVIENFFYLTSHRNKGAAFGILQNQQWLFILITCVVVIILAIYIIRGVKKESPWLMLAFSFVLGGAIGNLIDRIRVGEVTDFFHFIFGSYHFAIFNVADAGISVGVALLAIYALFIEPKIAREKKATVKTEES